MIRLIRAGGVIYVAGFVTALAIKALLGLCPSRAAGAAIDPARGLSPRAPLTFAEWTLEAAHRSDLAKVLRLNADTPEIPDFRPPSTLQVADASDRSRGSDPHLLLTPNAGELLTDAMQRYPAAPNASARPVAPDCNTNGTPDAIDLSAAAGGSDCDSNAVPDECQPDCNTNAVCDACDIGSRETRDSNQNTIPDECETYDELANGNHNAAPSLGGFDGPGGGGGSGYRNNGLNGGRGGGGGGVPYQNPNSNRGGSSTHSPAPNEGGETLATQKPQDEDEEEEPSDRDGDGRIPPVTQENDAPPGDSDPPTTTPNNPPGDDPTLNPNSEPPPLPDAPPTPEPTTAALLLIGAGWCNRRRGGRTR